ncbi:Uncharacterized protein OBRU01_12760 [Operophtera brumata]|uniref:Uncharacterized protein n=1 Tax=Operophtera brumata TaxID=104452 RepID=A0A0L7L8J2_OPEBR|nr:Uncharacterized protein OBRU01_12760 [Operophtera brumata]
MVLLGTNLTSAVSVCKGPESGFKIEAINNLTLGNIFFKLCKACQQNAMASIPPSAFSAARIRQTQQDKRDMKLTNTPKGSDSGNKLMNSIWGLYNRYSPHNVKKINDANTPSAGEFQQ